MSTPQAYGRSVKLDQRREVFVGKCADGTYQITGTTDEEEKAIRFSPEAMDAIIGIYMDIKRFGYAEMASASETEVTV